MSSIISIAKRTIHRVAAYVVAAILRRGAAYDLRNFKLWEQRGYHITPIHFYFPIPDTRELENKPVKKYDCRGIDLRPEFQLKLLREAFRSYASEYNAFPVKPTTRQAFYLDNDMFQGIDPHVYHCMIRHLKPSMIVEIGCGHSTLLGVQACRLNGSTRYVCVDPWPRDVIAEGIAGVELIRQKVEDLDADFFLQLKENDFLFVDSSHVVRTAGDVCFLILEVLPRLAPGVIVHFHDIFLPFDYPKEWVVDGLRFWTEQYLLHAYLIDNCHAEILFACNFITTHYAEEVRAAFPNALVFEGKSLWFRKV